MELGFDTLFLVLWGKSNGKDLTDSNIWVEPGPFTLLLAERYRAFYIIANRTDTKPSVCLPLCRRNMGWSNLTFLKCKGKRNPQQTRNKGFVILLVLKLFFFLGSFALELPLLCVSLQCLAFSKSDHAQASLTPMQCEIILQYYTVLLDSAFKKVRVTTVVLPQQSPSP